MLLDGVTIMWYSIMRGEVMTLGQRVKRLRKDELKLTMDKFGARIGVSRSVINNIERDALVRPEAREPLYRLICKEFNVSYDWLMHGVGEMFVTTPGDWLTAFRSKYKMGDAALSFIRAYIKMSDENKKIVDRFLDEWRRISAHFEADAENADSEPTLLTDPEVAEPVMEPRPLFTFGAAAGVNFSTATDEHDFIDVDVSLDVDFAVRVSGDSMEPALYDGDIALVRKQETLMDGEIGVFNVDGSPYIKRYHTDGDYVYLVSINRNRADTDITIIPDIEREAQIRGKVILPKNNPYYR